MFNASIGNYSELKNMLMLSLEYEFSIHESQAILVGYDKSCEQGKCSGS